MARKLTPDVSSALSQLIAGAAKPPTVVPSRFCLVNKNGSLRLPQISINDTAAFGVASNRPLSAAFLAAVIPGVANEKVRALFKSASVAEGKFQQLFPSSWKRLRAFLRPDACGCLPRRLLLLQRSFCLIGDQDQDDGQRRASVGFVTNNAMLIVQVSYKST